MTHNITVEGGTAVRLHTAGKYCDRDIVITATGGGGENGILPIGYTHIPSIKFTGTQAVNTGVICNQNTEIVAAYTADGDGSYYIYGVTNEAQTASITAYRSAVGGNWRFGNQRISLSTPVDEDVVWGVKVNKKRIIRANVTSAYTNVNDFTADKPLLIGGRLLDDGTVEESTMMIGKVLAFSVYDGEECIRHFLPCKNADGVCGFWDLVTESFFVSATDTPLGWGFL